MSKAKSTAPLVPTERAAAAAHLSAVVSVVAGMVVAGGPVIWAGMAAFAGPLAAWLVLRDPFARAHATAALRFNVSVAIYVALIGAGLSLLPAGPGTVQFVPFLLFMSLLVALNWLMFTAIAVQRALTGQTFTYPMTIRRLPL